MHKVGDFITIRKDLRIGCNSHLPSAHWCTSRMLPFAGYRVRIIRVVKPHAFNICVTGNKFYWSEDMFEGWNENDI
jgi:hypothetical protein